MSLKHIKPTTPGQRGRISLNFVKMGVGKFPPKISKCGEKDNPRYRALRTAVKYLQTGKKQNAGRNNQGRITVRHRGGGHKRNQRHILFQRHILHNLFQSQESSILEFAVQGLLYDPARASSLALISIDVRHNLEDIDAKISVLKKRKDVFVLREGPKSYIICFFIIAPQYIQVGQIFSYGNFENLEINPGKAMPIEYVPLGTLIHNVEINKSKGGQLVRAAGTYAQIIEKSVTKQRVRIRLPSGVQRWVLFGSMVTLGSVSNEEQRHVVKAKAGRSRWLSRRPKVRGVAMNPVDHPHGGGEGRTSGGRPSVTPWGRPTHGFSLRSPRKNPFIIS